MKPKFIERIHLNIPKPLIPKIDDFDNTAVQIINKAVIKAVEQINDAIFNEIVAIARSEGIDDIYLLDKKNIVSALSKQIPKKVRVKKISAESLAYICPCCTKKQISRIAGEWVAGQKNLYCPTCGQALDWGDGE